MEHIQLELDFEAPIEALPSRAQVVDFIAFSNARLKHQRDEDQERLLAEIVKSVEHITGRSPDAKAM